MKELLKDKKFLITTGIILLAVLFLIIISKVVGDGEGSSKENVDLEDKIKNTGYKVQEQKQDLLNSEEVSPLSGLKCQNSQRRPIAVMLASDPRTRPLAGTGAADLVIEMPVITSGYTRLMALYVCNSPREIGSIRSTRHDFISLAKGFDAILAHWGGSEFAKEYLKNNQTIDNLDADLLVGEKGQAPFWRKKGLTKPDNGFASYDSLLKGVREKNYRKENHFEGYYHREESKLEQRGSKGKLTLGFSAAAGMNVHYIYDPETNSFERFWAGQADVDANTGKVIAPKNVVVIFATSRQIKDQYNDVEIEQSLKTGSEMYAYIEGREIKGNWEKKKENCVIGDELVCVSNSKLRFLDEDGEEIQFIPGQIWVEVLEPGQKLEWELIE